MAAKARPASAAHPARVVLADDHPLSLAGLHSILAEETDLVIVGEACTGTEAVALCQHLQPDLVLMDVRMPELDGIAATRAIKQDSPQARVLILTIYEEPEYLLDALKAGVAGYLLKGASKQELLAAIRQALRGESTLSPELANRMLHRLAGERDRAAAPASVPLTPREYDVLQLLVQGMSNKQIAHDLKLSLSTVKVHVEHLFAKLGVADRTQAAVRAITLGIVTPSSG